MYFLKDRDQTISYSVSKVRFIFKERSHLVIKVRKSSMKEIVFIVSNIIQVKNIRFRVKQAAVLVLCDFGLPLFSHEVN